MEVVKLSKKYQVVIPKEVRKGLQLKPGQNLRVKQTASGDIKIETASVIDEMYGSLKGAWGKDSDKYLQKTRNEWDAPRG